MKKIIATLLCIAMLTALCGCGGGGGAETTVPTTTSAPLAVDLYLVDATLLPLLLPFGLNLFEIILHNFLYFVFVIFLLVVL